VSRTLFRNLAAATPAFSVPCTLAWLSAQAPAPAGALTTANGEWPAYHGSHHNAHYSPLDQINADNFGKLEIAWRFKGDSFGTRPEYKLDVTPGFQLVALDAESGVSTESSTLSSRSAVAITPANISPFASTNRQADRSARQSRIAVI
jgi:hypothetical protein